MLEEVNRRVLLKLSKSNDKIIIGAYRNMISSHSGFCGCNYCEVLKEYITEKKQLTRVKRLCKAEHPSCEDFSYYDFKKLLIKERILVIKENMNRIKEI